LPDGERAKEYGKAHGAIAKTLISADGPKERGITVAKPPIVSRND
jgi:hypothetical protein